MLNSKYAKSVIKPEYFKMLEYLFSSKNINLRNNIMHINRADYDYFAIQYTSLLFQLLWDICKVDIFRAEYKKF